MKRKTDLMISSAYWWTRLPQNVIQVAFNKRRNLSSIESAKKGSNLFSMGVQISGQNCSRTRKRKCLLKYDWRCEWLQFPVDVRYEIALRIQDIFKNHCRLFQSNSYALMHFELHGTIKPHYFQVEIKKRAIKMKYLLCSHH